MKTVLLYRYLSKSLEESILILSNILKAKKEIDGNYQIYPGFKLDVTLGDRCYVSFSGASEDLLRIPIKDFIKSAGNPYFVMGDYNLVAYALWLSSKRLKRKFDGFAIGKHVVDI